MKSAKEIISHIKSYPQYQILAELIEFKRFILLLLGERKGSMIAFIYIKDNTLFLALNNPNARFEFKHDNIINDIKNSLKVYKKACPTSQIPDILDVRFFFASEYINRIAKQDETNKSSDIAPFIEPSNGEFKNNIKDMKIHTLIEEIRGIIIANR